MTPNLAPGTPVASRAAYALALALAVVTAAAAIPTVFVDGVLRGPAVMNGSARGTALIMLIVAVPLLVGSTLATRRGVAPAVLLWLGAVAYLLYNAVMLLFGTPFNRLFLLYVAVLALAVWSAVVVLHAMDVEAFARQVDARLPVRAIAAYTWVIVALNALLWLKGIVPALDDPAPAFLAGTGLTTFPTYVQDLGFWLPLMAVAAWWLWQRAPWGFVVVGSTLTMWVVEGLGVAVDQAFGHAADPASTVVVPSMIPVFVALAVLGLAPVIAFWRSLRGGAVAAD